MSVAFVGRMRVFMLFSLMTLALTLARGDGLDALILDENPYQGDLVVTQTIGRSSVSMPCQLRLRTRFGTITMLCRRLAPFVRPLTKMCPRFSAAGSAPISNSYSVVSVQAYGN
jgi:hypothetical protein